MSAATIGQLGSLSEKSMPAFGSASSPGSTMTARTIRSPATAAGLPGVTAATVACTGIARPSDGIDSGLPIPAVSSSRQVTARGRTSTVRLPPSADSSLSVTVPPMRLRSRSSSVAGSPTGPPSTPLSRSPARIPAAAAGESSCTALIGRGVIAMPVMSRGCGGRSIVRLVTGPAFPSAAGAFRSTVSVTAAPGFTESAASSSA